MFLVMPAIIGGLLAWLVSEAIRGFRATRGVSPAQASKAEIRPVSGSHSGRPVIEVQGHVVETFPAQPAASAGRQTVRS